MDQPCEICGGRGTVINSPSLHCHFCKGTGFKPVHQRTKLELAWDKFYAEQFMKREEQA